MSQNKGIQPDAQPVSLTRKEPMTDEEMKAAAEQAAIEKASRLTAEQEEKAAEEAALREAEALEANLRAEEALREAAKAEEKRKAAFQKRISEARAKKPDESLRAEEIRRPVEVPSEHFKGLEEFPAHIAAHAIIANIHGDSYDPFHDNEFSKNPDGSVRCSVKLKGGGHQRFNVHVPDTVKLIRVPDVTLEEAA